MNRVELYHDIAKLLLNATFEGKKYNTDSEGNESLTDVAQEAFNDYADAACGFLTEQGINVEPALGLYWDR